MSQVQPINSHGSVVILWRKDQNSVFRPTTFGKFSGVAEALAAVGVTAIPVEYEDNVIESVRRQLLGVQGVLVWVNPIHDGKSRGFWLIFTP